MRRKIIPTPHEVTIRELLKVIPLELENIPRDVLMCNYSGAKSRIKSVRDNLYSILFLISELEKENKGL